MVVPLDRSVCSTATVGGHGAGLPEQVRRMMGMEPYRGHFIRICFVKT